MGIRGFSFLKEKPQKKMNHAVLGNAKDCDRSFPLDQP